MSADGKPYRVYKGGRAKGRVPLERITKEPEQPQAGAAGTKPRRRIGRWVALTLLGATVLLLAWAVASYMALSRGLEEANERVPGGVRAQLTDDDGLLVSEPTTILMLGTDGGVPGRESANRSDSIMLLHTDPSRKRLAYLSIPRDLQVEVPGFGTAKINAAFQWGGPALALRTVEQLTGLDVNHVAFVDFAQFGELIDALGGIEIDVRKPIRSGKFDCPFATQADCDRWQGWRFAKGTQQLDGRRALVYSRIRKNELDASETDFERGRRQQQVVQATLDEMTSLSTLVRLPFVGDDLVRPLATDLGAWELMQLGWVYFRADADKALHCRLGGDPATVGGESVILGTEDNVSTIAMFTGSGAPLAPPEGQPYAPGCRVGERG